MLISTIFYIAVGIVLIGYFAIESGAPAHIPILGILSLLTAYLVFRLSKWALPLIAGLFVTGITFAATTLADSFTLQGFDGAILFHIALIAYMIILLIVSVYLLAKRQNFN
jgi:hypothetical protein